MFGIGGMRRRDFITLLGGAWPFTAKAQVERVRRIGFLEGAAENQDTQAGIAAFRDELAKRGWVKGRNLRIDVRFGSGDPAHIWALAAELVGLSPEVMITDSGIATSVAQEQTRTIPIV